jgi:hypothetical protein
MTSLKSVSMIIPLNIAMLIYGAIFLYRFIQQLCIKYDYQHPGISELLINYEGGFVRRGAFGQLLFEICSHLHLSPYPVILAVYVLSFSFVIAFFLYMLVKKKLSLYLMPMAFFVCGFVTDGGSWIRKDCMMIAGLIFTLIAFQKTNHISLKIIWVNAITILLTLNHEAYLFFSVPVLVLIFCSQFSESSNQSSLSHRIKPLVYSLLCLAPSLVCALLCFSYKGDYNTAHAIWRSWFPLIGEQPIGYSVDALGWSTAKTISAHFYKNFLEPISGSIPLPSILKWLVIFPIVYYLSVNTLWVFQKNNNHSEKDRTYLSFIIIFQFICLLPMFTFLSCDYLRLMHYWILSSFAVYLLIPTRFFLIAIPQPLLTLTSKANYIMNRIVPPCELSVGVLIILIGLYQHANLYI